MRTFVLNLTALVAGLMLASCGGQRAATRPGVDRNVLTQDQFANRDFHSVYELVEALRSNWLTRRGPDSFAAPTQVLVYLDGSQLGGIETMRTIDPRSVTYIRFFD